LNKFFQTTDRANLI